MPQLGAIIQLTKDVPGIDKKTAKAALIEANDDYEAALAAMMALHGVKDEDAAEEAEAEERAATRSGVTVLRLEPGDGETFPEHGDRLSIHYRGTLLDYPERGEFDSSYKRMKEFKFTIGVGEVIRGWDEGVKKLSEGEKAVLEISPDYGYGAAGHPPTIPPHAALRFEVHLVKVERTRGNRDSLHASEYKKAAKMIMGQS